MTLSQKELIARAKRRLVAIERRRRDPRFSQVIGRLCASGHLTTSFEVTPHKDAIRVADALWVGEVEPRVLELLPALLVNQPSLFEDPRSLPRDLADAVAALRRKETPADFRGIAGADVARWQSRTARSDRGRSRLKAFRLRPPELELLGQLSVELGVTETEVVRSGLRELAAKHLDSAPKPPPGPKAGARKRLRVVAPA